MRTRAFAALSSAVLGLALWAMPAATAHAYTRFVDGIGLMTGYYDPGYYRGVKQPSGDGFCVRVDRMAAGTNIWKTEGVTNYLDCSASDGSSAWSITNDTYANNTHKIRLVNTYTGQWFYLCANTTACRGM